MKERILVALVGIPLVLAAVCAPVPWVFWGLLVVAAWIAQNEFDRLLDPAPPFSGLNFAAGVASLLCVVFLEPFALPIFAAFTLLALLVLSRTKPRPNAFKAYPLIGLLPLAALQPLPARETIGPSYVLMALVPLWVGDSAAYFIGKAFGKHKFAPSISPNKTWEGAIANLLGCLLGAWLIGEWLKVPLGVSLACGAVSGILGQAGDLFESFLKRRAGVKDSGNLLPGHGGMLDRLDSLIATAPFVTLILLLAR